MEKVPCPNCGYENRPKAVLCNLCKAAMPLALAAERDRVAEGKKPRRKLRPKERSSFYEEKSKNISRSNILLAALTAILTLLGAAMGGVYGEPVIGAVAAFIVAGVMGLVSWVSGKKLILSMSGAVKADHDTNPQLFNVVEEMKIASGLPMPEVYIIPSAAPNAFATGRDPDHSAVAVTSGLLEKLDRGELQGVIAHEMSHIRNFDIRYAMLTAVLVGSIALICDTFLRGRFRGGRGNPAMVAVAAALAIVAPISAYMLQMAISRRREFLADASAVELTRNPDGLASALAKIALDPAPLEAANRATQHLYIMNPVKKFTMKSGALFSTHPPTEARIQALRSMGASG